MDFNINPYISNFIENQFPQFYQEEGPDFILFVKAYYEWLETSGNPIYQSRKLQDYRDIDNTLEEFLEFFQKKYLYGIPFNVIANKRFLLKHILEIYRSKGTIQCYRLLFKLLYNEDIEIYLPGRDILRVSDGTWTEPKYLEVSTIKPLQYLVGKTVIGGSSKTTAVVENYVKESYNNDIINIIYVSNILPRGGEFEIGEKITFPEELSNPISVSEAPTILGSLESLAIINGGQNFNVGDTIKILQKDSNNNILSYGVDGILRVSALSRGIGSLNFNIQKQGFGYTTNALTFVYKNGTDGENASFNIGSIFSSQTLEFNTDLVCDYSNLTIDATSYGFNKDPNANLTSNIGTTLSTNSQIFGSILNLTNIKTGNGYNQPANVFVRSVQTSKPLTGSIAYNTNSNTVIGTNTIFNYIFSNNDVISLNSNVFLNSTLEYQVIKEVISNTEILLYGPPTYNSTSSAAYMAAPTILPSQYALYETPMFSSDNTINGENENIKALPSVGNNVVSSVSVINSGKGYADGEEVRAYLYSGVSSVVVVLNSGVNYSNNDSVVFSGGNPGTSAQGYISTYTNGSISNVTVTFPGSGYESVPSLSIISNTGSGGVISSSLTEYNFSSEIVGKIIKTGSGKGKGYWSTTRGFLNSDKYIQDSFYYQDYSYEIRVAQTLNKYKDILYDTFHIAGSELFGEYSLSSSQAQLISLVSENVDISADFWGADSSSKISFLSSSTLKSADEVDIRASFDEYTYVGLTADYSASNTDTWGDLSHALISSTNYLTADSGKINIGYIKSDSTQIKADNRKLIRYIFASSDNFKADNDRIAISRYYI